MTRLSVNINKIATLRNARGGDIPDVIQAAIRCQEFGAQGITVHPRPDERHITLKDVYALKPVISTEFNIEGFPTRQFMDMVLEVMPHQVTLVPDAPSSVTSNRGWVVTENKNFLIEIVSELKAAGIRTSIFVGTDPEQIEAAKETGTKRIELYTEPYATNYRSGRKEAIRPFVLAAEKASALGLELNAGHDLSLENLKYFSQNIPSLLEVSIGHALISDALYYGLRKTIRLYRRQLR